MSRETMDHRPLTSKQTKIEVHDDHRMNDNHPKHTERVNFWSFESVRMQIGILMCLNFFILAVMRNNLGVAIVCMVNSTAVEEREMLAKNISNYTAIEEEKEERNEQAKSRGCPVPERFAQDYQGEFSWSSSEQGMLFAAVYWGSFSTLPAGWLADRYSPKMTLLASGVLNTIGTVFIPLAARNGGFPVLFIMRCFAGIGQGLQRPATNAILARWVPTDERSTVVSLYTAGNQFSNIIGTPLFAWLCRLRHVSGGWPLIFYSSAGMGIIWCILWFILATDKPEKCKRIKTKELDYISFKLRAQGTQKQKSWMNVPWRELFTSMPVIACVVCSVANGMVLSLAGSYVPTYFMNVLYMDLESNGFFAALPFVVQWLMKFVFAALADNLLRRKKFSPTMLSKVFNTIASLGTGGFLFGCSLLSCEHKAWAITFLCLSFGFFGVFACGYWTSMVNIAPSYVGMISALATTALTVGCIAAPYLVGALVKDGTREEWQLVFAIISVCMLVSAVFFIVFGSADIQSWSTIQNDSRNGDDKRRSADWHSRDDLITKTATVGLLKHEKESLNENITK